VYHFIAISYYPGESTKVEGGIASKVVFIRYVHTGDKNTP